MILYYLLSHVNKQGKVNCEEFWMEFGVQTSSTYRGRASLSVCMDKEARSANSDAPLPRAKRAQPIVISTGWYCFELAPDWTCT